jgi:hypothetical protein
MYKNVRFNRGSWHDRAAMKFRSEGKEAKDLPPGREGDPLGDIARAFELLRAAFIVRAKRVTSAEAIAAR